jgi:hypothetical protein
MVGNRTNLLTHGAERFWRSCQLCSHSRCPSVLWNPKVHYRLHKSPPPVSILSQIDPIPTIPSYLSKINFNIVHPPTSWSTTTIIIIIIIIIMNCEFRKLTENYSVFFASDKLRVQ